MSVLQVRVLYLKYVVFSHVQMYSPTICISCLTANLILLWVLVYVILPFNVNVLIKCDSVISLLEFWKTRHSEISNCFLHLFIQQLSNSNMTQQTFETTNSILILQPLIIKPAEESIDAKFYRYYSNEHSNSSSSSSGSRGHG